ncbi:unnamed protein product, partial [Phaeothamnion confervicola]
AIAAAATAALAAANGTSPHSRGFGSPEPRPTIGTNSGLKAAAAAAFGRDRLQRQAGRKGQALTAPPPPIVPVAAASQRAITVGGNGGGAVAAVVGVGGHGGAKEAVAAAEAPEAVYASGIGRSSCNSAAVEQIALIIRAIVGSLPMPLPGGRKYHIYLESPPAPLPMPALPPPPPLGSGAAGTATAPVSEASSPASGANPGGGPLQPGSAWGPPALGADALSVAPLPLERSVSASSTGGGVCSDTDDRGGVDASSGESSGNGNGSGDNSPHRPSAKTADEASGGTATAGTVIVTAAPAATTGAGPMELSMPPYSWLPFVDIDYAAPFHCLSVAHVVAVFSLMLQEGKIIFLSKRAALLTQVMEAFRSLIFPMTWQSLYVPRLPRALYGCLDAPGGYMLGLHLSEEDMGTCTAD